MATVIFGIGLLIGSRVYVSQPAQVARQSVPLASPLSPLPPIVGRITGMVECKFEEGFRGSDPKSEIRNQKSEISCSFGDKFALASGLMEITYDTGARSFCRARSPMKWNRRTADILSVGKLTARVEKKWARGSGLGFSKSLNPHPSSLIPLDFHFPHSPTAIVTDLGTEFGVEVHESGSTTAYVFRGAVQVQPGGVDGKQGGKAVRLIENESVRVEKQGSGEAVKVDAAKADPAAFVRFAQLPKLAENKD